MLKNLQNCAGLLRDSALKCTGFVQDCEEYAVEVVFNSFEHFMNTKQSAVMV